jgi:hypothetical protein
MTERNVGMERNIFIFYDRKGAVLFVVGCGNEGWKQK